MRWFENVDTSVDFPPIGKIYSFIIEKPCNLEETRYLLTSIFVPSFKILDTCFIYLFYRLGVKKFQTTQTPFL